MIVQACFISSIGGVRTNNEDSMLLNDVLITEADMPAPECRGWTGGRHVFAVADGMGGHARGEAASRAVLEVLRDNPPDSGNNDQVASLIRAARGRLNAMAAADPSYLGAGTTLTGIRLGPGRGVVFNCGDSRVYRIAGGKALRITRDHSVVQGLVDEGVISEDAMRTHPQKNVLTSAVIGDLREREPEVSAGELEVGAEVRYLVCSDGVWESLADADIEACCVQEDLSRAAACLTNGIRATGARDNYSFILLQTG